MILETSRLYLREITPDDAETAYLLNLDPEVIRYTGDEPFANIDEAKDFLNQYPDYRKNGFGRWAVIRKNDGEFLGWCGLKLDSGDVDIGFRFFRKFWNNGYATESARACISFGFENLNLQRIIGRVMPENEASKRVLEKCGLEFVAECDFEPHAGLLYEIKKN